MKVSIIGTGNVGRALAGSLVRAGHEVVLAGRDADRVAAVAAEVGAAAVPTARAAAEAGDVVIIAVDFVASGEAVAREIAPVVGGKVVVDLTNPASPDFTGLVTEGGPSAAERFADWLPGARVVKALNTVVAAAMADPGIHGATIDALIATDDDAARATVAELVRSIGFRPVDAGELRRARELEALAWLHIAIQIRHRGDWRGAFVLVGAPERATASLASAA